jgi:DNA-binding transcriptional ArsR family regulator
MPDDSRDLGPEPDAERLISDVETLKALSDPLRLRILELMTTGRDETFTVKRLAAALDVSQTKLYHHINLLVERGLIRPVATRVVSGIIETSYRIAQLSVRLDRGLLTGDSPELHDMLTTVFDGAREDIERGIRAGVIDLSERTDPLRRVILAKGLTRLSPARATEFRARLDELMRSFDDNLPDTEGDPYGFVLSFYPMTGIPAEVPTDPPAIGASPTPVP